MTTLSLSAPPKSFVADFIILASEGSTLADTDINSEVFNNAVELMRNNSDITDFDDITDFLGQNSCDASCVFGVNVTPETDIAFATYLTWSI